MIRLTDLINIAGIELKDFKIHLATGARDKPINAFYEGKFQEWQESQRQLNFECKQVIGLIHMGADQWLFAGLWLVHGSTKKMGGYRYSTTEVKGLEHLAGRVMISFVRTFRQSYLRGDSYGSKLLVLEIRPERLSVADFPGYSSVNLSFDTLRIVARQRLTAWITALRSVAGVYLIADMSNGRHYVGSAYGEGGLWGRWESYSKKGHGGNRDLIELLKEKGEAHATNFIFSILEICDPISTKDEVLSRECHWKRVLLSREFGYNKN
jgi:hypothetical protein